MSDGSFCLPQISCVSHYCKVYTFHHQSQLKQNILLCLSDTSYSPIMHQSNYHNQAHVNNFSFFDLDTFRLLASSIIVQCWLFSGNVYPYQSIFQWEVSNMKLHKPLLTPSFISNTFSMDDKSFVFELNFYFIKTTKKIHKL